MTLEVLCFRKCRYFDILLLGEGGVGSGIQCFLLLQVNFTINLYMM